MISQTNLKPTALTEAEAETQLLLSTDNNGRIPFPEGSSREVDYFLRALSRLDEGGHIEHRLQNGYLSCYLTESGMLLRSDAIASRGDASHCSAPRFQWDRSPGGKSLLALTVLLLSVAVPLKARLGESPDRIEARYGAPLTCENGVGCRDFRHTYKHGGFVIVVCFLDEKSQCESYSNENGEPLAPEDIQTLLAINGRGGRWNLKKNTESSRQWVSDSADAFATEQHENGHSLEIKTSWWLHFIDGHPAIARTEVKERLKDF
jgi:hypothetical protein